MAYNYNHITLVGRLSKDPDFLDNGSVMRTRFFVAVQRHFKKEPEKKEVDFIPVVLWGSLAELAAKYLKKGSPVLIEGRMQIRKYLKDEEVKWMTEVSAYGFQFLGRGGSKKEEELHQGEA